jgi:hypothetical protein
MTKPEIRMTNKVANSKQQENDVGELGLGIPNIFSSAFSAFSAVRRTEDRLLTRRKRRIITFAGSLCSQEMPKV